MVPSVSSERVCRVTGVLAVARRRAPSLSRRACTCCHVLLRRQYIGSWVVRGLAWAWVVSVVLAGLVQVCISCSVFGGVPRERASGQQRGQGIAGVGGTGHSRDDWEKRDNWVGLAGSRARWDDIEGGGGQGSKVGFKGVFYWSKHVLATGARQPACVIA